MEVSQALDLLDEWRQLAVGLMYEHGDKLNGFSIEYSSHLKLHGILKEIAEWIESSEVKADPKPLWDYQKAISGVISPRSRRVKSVEPASIEQIEIILDEALDCWERICMSLRLIEINRTNQLEPNVIEWTEWQSPSQWRTWINEQLGELDHKGNVIPMPQTSWRRFRDKIPYEEHPSKGNKLVRFDKQKLLNATNNHKPPEGAN